MPGAVAVSELAFEGSARVYTVTKVEPNVRPCLPGDVICAYLPGPAVFCRSS